MPGALVGVDRGSQRALGVQKPRPRRPDGDAEDVGCGAEPQVEVVAQGQDGPMPRGEPSERPLELIADGDEVQPVVDRPWMEPMPDGCHPRGALTLGPREAMRRTDDQPMQPGLESVRIPQASQPKPRGDEGFLDRIVGRLRVAQDPKRGPVKRRSRGHGQDREGMAIARHGPDDALSIHRWS